MVYGIDYIGRMDSVPDPGKEIIMEKQYSKINYPTGVNEDLDYILAAADEVGMEVTSVTQINLAFMAELIKRLKKEAAGQYEWTGLCVP